MPGRSRRVSTAPQQVAAPQQRPSVAGPGQDLAGEQAPASATPTLDAVAAEPGMPPDELADVLVRAARGEEVPPEELTSAQLSVDVLDDAGTAVVLDRLRREGLLDQVVDEGVLTADERTDMLNRVDVQIRATVLPTEGFPDAELQAQIAWAERTYASHGMQLVVEVSEPLSADRASAMLSAQPGGRADAAEFNRGDREDPPAPGTEVEALLNEAWQHGAADSAHVVFLSGSLPGADGATFQPGLYETSQPGAIVAQGSRTSVFGHELGHLLGLGHIEDEQGSEREGGNLMATDSPRGGDLTPDQIARVQRSLRVQLVPRQGGERAETPTVGQAPGVMPP